MMNDKEKMRRSHLASTLAMMRRHSAARTIGVDTQNEYSNGWSMGLKVGLRLIRRHLEFIRRNHL